MSIKVKNKLTLKKIINILKKCWHWQIRMIKLKHRLIRKSEFWILDEYLFENLKIVRFLIKKNIL